MKLIKKKMSFILALAICAMMVLSMTACTGGNNSSNGDSGSQPATPPSQDSGSAASSSDNGVGGTISLMMLKTNEPGMTAVLSDFATAYPDVTVSTEFISDLSQFDTAVPTRFAAGNSTDLCHLIAGKGGPVCVVPIAETGKLVDLSDQPWVSSMYEPTKDLFMLDGKVYAKDFGFCPLACLQYDKDFFTQNNLQVPTTFDELVEVCKEIKALGKVPISWAAGEVFVNTNNFIVMGGNTVASKDPDWLTKRLSGETKFAGDPGWTEALTQMKELIDIGAFAPGAAAMSMSDMISSFANGDSEMMFTYGGMVGLALAEVPDKNIGQVAFPGATVDSTRVTLQAAGGMAVATTCKNLDAAYALLNFWSKPEEGDAFADASAIISPNQAITGNLSGYYSELQPMFAANQVIPDPTAVFPNASLNEKLGSSLQGLFTGQKTIDQILVDYDTYFDEQG